MNKTVEGDFTVRESYRILSADSTTGSFDMILPATPGEGLEWDTTWLAEYGYILVVQEGTVGLENRGVLSEFSIFPNPGSGIVRLKVTGQAEGGSEGMLRCYDQQGRQVHQEVIHDGRNGGISLDVSHWSPGMYMFVLTIDNRTGIQQFVKQ
jgi:hypothetical protein